MCSLIIYLVLTSLLKYVTKSEKNVALWMFSCSVSNYMETSSLKYISLMFCNQYIHNTNIVKEYTLLRKYFKILDDFVVIKNICKCASKEIEMIRDVQGHNLVVNKLKFTRHDLMWRECFN